MHFSDLDLLGIKVPAIVEEEDDASLPAEDVVALETFLALDPNPQAFHLSSFCKYFFLATS